jgi:hypothetical protein
VARESHRLWSGLAGDDNDKQLSPKADWLILEGARRLYDSDKVSTMDFL